MFVLVHHGIKAISKNSWNPFHHGSVQVCKKVKERFQEDCTFNQKGKQNVHRMCNLRERERVWEVGNLTLGSSLLVPMSVMACDKRSVCNLKKINKITKSPLKD
jgi:hypothetical protein